MMKRLLVLFGWLIIIEIGLAPIAFAQSDNAIAFEFISNYRGVKSPVITQVPDHAVYQVLEPTANDRSLHNVPKSPILLGLKLSSKQQGLYPINVKSISKSYSSYIISDSSEAVIIAMGINKNNVNDYLYRVVENDSTEIVPWSKIQKLEQGYGAKQPYGFIGKFKALGKQLLVEVKNVKDYSIRDGIIFDWRVNFKPLLSQIAVFAKNKQHHTEFFNLNYAAMNEGYATKFDPITNIPLDFKFPSGKIVTIRLFFNPHESIPFSMHMIMKIRSLVDTIPLATFTEAYQDVNSDAITEPGKYEIIIQREGGKGPTIRIPFEILPMPILDHRIPVDAVIFFGVVFLIIAGLIFFFFYRRNKEKLKRAAHEKQLAGLKLRSIRSQLNPHFMFNALTSIQNLINKNNVADANYYLSKFAGLTRQVLDSNNEEVLSIEEELNLINDYLQMEQLRFNFQYDIQVDDELDKVNIEIPAMLLQPFVENAVKHGISALKEMGKITVKIIAKEKDMVLSVEDNGKGFMVNEKYPGYGLKLSDEHVVLLNQIYKDQIIELNIVSDQNGTVITIRLSNWIA